MHGEASPTVENGSPSVTLRRRARRGIGVLAVLMNVVLFAAGLYFQAHARDRRDLWTAGGVAGVAVLNSAALTVPRRGPGGARVVDRLRRISLFANSILLVVAAVIVAFASLREWLDAALHGTLLFFPPLLTLLALRRYPQG